MSEIGRKNILIVDDLPANLSLLFTVLHSEHDIEVCESGLAALERLSQRRFDLILLDIMMPELDGFLTFARIRSIPGCARTPIVFITANNDAATEERGLSLGAADFIIKPFHVNLIRLRIRNILAMDQLSRELGASEERLSHVMAATGEGIWDWWVTSDTVIHNRRWCQLLGLDESTQAHSLSFCSGLIHPEDASTVRQTLENCLRGPECATYHCVYRTQHASGHYLWVEDRGRVVSRYGDGRPSRMVGCIRDISDRKRDEERIHQLAFSMC